MANTSKAAVEILVKLKDLVSPDAKKLAQNLGVVGDAADDSLFRLKKRLLEARQELGIARKNFKEFGAENDELAGEVIRLENEIDGLNKSIRESGKEAEDTGSKWADAAVTAAKWAAGLLTVKEGFDFLKDSVKVAADMEAANRKLDAALIASGQSTEKNAAALRTMAGELKSNSSISREAALEGIALSVAITGSAEAAAGLNKVAADYAAATSKPFRDAIIAVSKAAVGNTDSLRENGIIIDKNDIATRGYTAVVEKLNAQFGGSAQAQVRTYTGQLKQLENEFIDLKVEIGEEFAPTLIKVFQTARTAIIWLPGFLEETFANLDALTGLAIELFKRGGIPGLIVGTAPEAARAAFVALTDDTKNFGDEFAKDLRGSINKILDERTRVIADIEKEQEFKLAFKEDVAVEDIKETFATGAAAGTEVGVKKGMAESEDDIAASLARGFAKTLAALEPPEKLRQAFVGVPIELKQEDLEREKAKLEKAINESLRDTAALIRGFAGGTATSLAQALAGQMGPEGQVAAAIIALLNRVGEDEEFIANFAASFSRGAILGIQNLPDALRELAPLLIPEIINPLILAAPEVVRGFAEQTPFIIAALIADMPLLAEAFVEAWFGFWLNPAMWLKTGEVFWKGILEAFGGEFRQELSDNWRELMSEAFIAGGDEGAKRFVRGILPAFDEAAKRFARGVAGAPGGLLEDVTGALGFQEGTPFVRRTGPAFLHRGEAVVPAEFNPANRRTGTPPMAAPSAAPVVVVLTGPQDLSSVGARLGMDGRQIDEIGRALRTRGFL